MVVVVAAVTLAGAALADISTRDAWLELPTATLPPTGQAM